MIGRPRRWAREDLLLVAVLRGKGTSWRKIGATLGTSGSRAYELFTGAPPTPRDPATWELVRGDAILQVAFRKCGSDVAGSRAGAAALAPGRPGRARPRGSSRNRKTMQRGRGRPPAALVRVERSERGSP